MVTSTALTALRTYLKDSIAYATYTVGEVEHQAQIQSAELLEDGRVAVTFLIATESEGSARVNCVRLFDDSGKMWAEKEEQISIVRPDAAEGILYRFRFSIIEAMNEED